MEALGQLSPVANLEAKIQSRVAKFLGLKESLIKLMKSSDFSVQSSAKELYGNQLSLEKDLTANLSRIEQIKQGAYTWSDIIDVGDFAYNMEQHINKVQKLMEKGGATIAVASTEPPPFSTWVILSGGALFLLYLLFRK